MSLMTRVRTAAVTLAATAFLAASPLRADNHQWDVSYFWGNKAAAESYKEKVLGVLGSGMTDDLCLAEGRNGNFGVIYNRDGTEAEG